MTGEPDLIALVGSRICHDLISPIGAIGNGIELLELSGAHDTPEVALISESVASANARIRFFRIAYGLAPPDGVLPRGEVARIIDDTFRGSRLTVVWAPDGPHPREEVKLAFLCLQCLESAMPQGGEITIRHRAAGWHLRCDAPALRIDDNLWRPLTDPQATLRLTSSDVQFGVLRQLTMGRMPALRVDIGRGGITMGF